MNTATLAQARHAMHGQWHRDHAELQLRIEETERLLKALRRQLRDLPPPPLDGAHVAAALLPPACGEFPVAACFVADLTPEEVRGLNLDFGEAQPAPDAEVMEYDEQGDVWNARRPR